ncbi:hypothetical protein [Brevundimonas sp.]|uniref:hypothetical protein n=1 Tax=Brevundimonas sp. TaxID=1871086 RepID=UPI0037BF4A87
MATRSRPKALEAWGSRQDLFATGLARELSGGPDYEAALADPGAVIERGLSVDIGKLGRAAKPRAASGPSKAKREKIARLEAALEALDIDHAQAGGALDDQIAQIEARRAALNLDHARARKRRLAELKKARG